MIKPRNFLVPILRKKGAKEFTDKKKDGSRKCCRNFKWKNERKENGAVRNMW